MKFIKKLINFLILIIINPFGRKNRSPRFFQISPFYYLYLLQLFVFITNYYKDSFFLISFLAVEIQKMNKHRIYLTYIKMWSTFSLQFVCYLGIMFNETGEFHSSRVGYINAQQEPFIVSTLIHTNENPVYHWHNLMMSSERLLLFAVRLMYVRKKITRENNNWDTRISDKREDPFQTVYVSNIWKNVENHFERVAVV